MAKLGLNALGAAVSGGLAGYRMAKQDQAADDDRAFMKSARSRQQKQWDREDENRRMLDEATKASRQALMSHLGIAPGSGSEQTLNEVLSTDPYARASADATPPLRVKPGLTASLSSAATGPEQASSRRGLTSAILPSTSTTKFSPKMPVEEAMPLALQARAEHLIRAGADPELWMPAWKQAAEARAAVRNRRMDEDWAKFQISGDPTVLTRSYSQLDDGHDFVGAERVDGKSGPTWNMTRRNRATGETETTSLSGDQIVKGFLSFRDPEAARKIEAESLIDRFKLGGKRDLQQNEFGFKREEGEKDRASRERIANIDAASRREVAQTRVDGQVRISQLRGGSGGSSKAPYVKGKQLLADGRVLLYMSDGGQRIAADDDGTPYIGDKAVDQALRAAGIVAKSIQGIGMTPDQQADAGAGIAARLGQRAAAGAAASPKSSGVAAQADDILSRFGVKK